MSGIFILSWLPNFSSILLAGETGFLSVYLFLGEETNSSLIGSLLGRESLGEPPESLGETGSYFGSSSSYSIACIYS